MVKNKICYYASFVNCFLKEHEDIGLLPFVGFGLQVLISGSADSLDIDDLRENTNYSGGYNAVSNSFLVIQNTISHCVFETLLYDCIVVVLLTGTLCD